MAFAAKTTSAPLLDGWLETVVPEARRAEAARLLQIFGEVTGFPLRLWGSSMVGFGRYEYRYDSGHTGESLASGFAMRTAEVSVYILPGYADFGEVLARLGPHRLGKSCLYLKKVSAVDEGALRDLIRGGLDDLGKRWTVLPE